MTQTTTQTTSLQLDKHYLVKLADEGFDYKNFVRFRNEDKIRETLDASGASYNPFQDAFFEKFFDELGESLQYVDFRAIAEKVITDLCENHIAYKDTELVDNEESYEKYFEDEEEIQPVDPIELAIKNPLFERWWGGWSPSDHYQIANTTDFLCALATDGIDSAINKQIAEEKAFREEQE